MATYIYDIETYPNYTLFLFKHTQTGEYLEFDNGSLDLLVRFLNTSGLTLVGYNNSGFDDIFLVDLLNNGPKTAFEYHTMTNGIIGRTHNNAALKTLKNKIRSGDTTWRSIDLMKIIGDVGGGLKQLQVKYNWSNVLETPIPFDTMLTNDQKSIVYTYCENDVNSTEFIYNTPNIQKRISTRLAFEEKYSYMKNRTTILNDSGIADSFFDITYATRARVHGSKLFKIRQGKKDETFYFDGNRHIVNDVEYGSEHNINVLEAFKKKSFKISTKNDKGDDDKFISSHVFKLPISGITFTLGKGGIHSSLPPIIAQGDDIVYADVGSYYPSLLLKMNASPSGLNSNWLDILKEITTERLKAKDEGRSTDAEVLKIVINSTYGKLGAAGSLMYDMTLMLRTTINGQLLLIMLMEELELAGHHILGTNTDGVIIKAGDAGVDGVNAIINDWSKKTGLIIEGKRIPRFVALNVNNYCIHTGKDWKDRKGVAFKEEVGKHYVVADAILNNITTGQSVREYMESVNDITPFIIASKKTKEFTLTYNGSPTQNINRWYKSKAGYPILSSRDGVASALVPNSENAILVNNVTDFSAPDDLDRDWYINKAEKLLKEIQEGVSDIDYYTKLLKGAGAIKEMGFVVVPKSTDQIPKKNVPKVFTEEVISRWKNEPLTDEVWYKYKGFGVYTGKEFGVIGIDIDELDRVKNTDLFKYIPKTTGFVAHHGEGLASLVKRGDKRGTIVFKYSGDRLKTTGRKFLQDNGFELLYGDKVVQLRGVHENGDTYKYAGQLTEIPDKLKGYLEGLLNNPLDDSYDNDDAVDVDDGVEGSDRLSIVKDYINHHPEYIAVNGNVKEKEIKGTTRLQGVCPNWQDHPTSPNTWMVGVSGNNVWTRCFHNERCSHTDRLWTGKISHALKITQKTQECEQGVDDNTAIPIIVENYAEIEQKKELFIKKTYSITDALKDDDKNALIQANTGSGKTYNIANLVINNALNNQKTFVILATNTSLSDMHFEIWKVARSLEVFDTQLTHSSDDEYPNIVFVKSANDSIDMASRDNIPKDFNGVVITNFAFAGRYGHSQYLHQKLAYIDDNTHVIIDEADGYISNLQLTCQLGSRHVRNRMVSKCPINTGNNNCTNCEANHFSFDIYEPEGSSGLPVLRQRVDFSRQDDLHRNTNFDYERITPVVQTIPDESSVIKVMKSYTDPRPIKFYNREERVHLNRDNFLDGITRSGWRPTEHTSRIWDAKENRAVDPAEMVELINKNTKERDKPSIANIPDRERYVFPYRPCNVKYINAIDRDPFDIIKKSSRLTMFTATLCQQHKDYLRDVVSEDIVIHEVLPSEDRKLNKLIVIGYGDDILTGTHIKKKKNDDYIMNFNGKPILVFKPTIAKAERFWNEIGSIVKCELIIKSQHRVFSGDEFQSKNQGVVIDTTHSLGVMGRGVNLPKYKGS